MLLPLKPYSWRVAPQNTTFGERNKIPSILEIPSIDSSLKGSEIKRVTPILFMHPEGKDLDKYISSTRKNEALRSVLTSRATGSVSVEFWKWKSTREGFKKRKKKVGNFL